MSIYLYSAHKSPIYGLYWQVRTNVLYIPAKESCTYPHKTPIHISALDERWGAGVET